jgi:hypothetical protein
VQAVLLAALAALQARAARRQVVPQGLQRRGQLQPRQRPVRVPRGWVARGRDPVPGWCSNRRSSAPAADDGQCCATGWTGDDCTQPLKRPCTNRLSDTNDIPPLSHIDAHGRDLNVTAPGWTPGRCAGGRTGWPGRSYSCWQAGAVHMVLQSARRARAHLPCLFRGYVAFRYLRRRVWILLVRLPSQVRVQAPQGLV